MVVKIFIFGRKGGLPDIFGERGELNGGTALVSINFINQPAVTIEEFGGSGSRVPGEIGGVRQAPEQIKTNTTNTTNEYQYYK